MIDVLRGLIVKWQHDSLDYKRVGALNHADACDRCVAGLVAAIATIEAPAIPKAAICVDRGCHMFEPNSTERTACEASCRLEGHTRIVTAELAAIRAAREQL